MSLRPLTTTHFALLCLLSSRPSIAAYDLVNQTRRSIGAVWPRAESNLYTGLKRLATDGLAEASTDQIGRRPRTTYHITPAGRHALTEWLESPGGALVFESEALLKLGFAPSSSKEAALHQVRVVAEDAARRVQIGRRLATEYVDGEGPLPERLHINAVMWKFLSEMNNATARWAEWAQHEIEAWPNTNDSPAMRERGLSVLRAGLEEAG